MTWDKTKPAGNLPVSVGDDHIRLNNEHLEDALSREHSFPGSFGTNSGRHMLPVAADYATMIGLGGLVDGMIVGRSDFPTLFQRQSGSFVCMKGYGHGDDSDRTGISTVIPSGYLFFCEDSRLLWEWTGAAWMRAAFPGGIIYAEDESFFVTTLTANDTWTEFLTAVATPLQADLTLPSYGSWYVFAQARLCVYLDADVAAYVAVRLTRRWGAGADSEADHLAMRPDNKRSHHLFLSDQVSGSAHAGETIHYQGWLATDSQYGQVYGNGKKTGETYGGPSIDVTQRSIIQVQAVRYA